ncbi:hypothetical protein, partial [Rothia dentocariosa]|uniref:hypothetical protein n=1 Tax=Rothia dentocariosa TaxID=2047 RepID=UPI001EE4A00C
MAEYSAPQQIEPAELSGEEDYFDKDKSYTQQKASRFGIVQTCILTISPFYICSKQADITKQRGLR